MIWKWVWNNNWCHWLKLSKNMRLKKKTEQSNDKIQQQILFIAKSKSFLKTAIQKHLINTKHIKYTLYIIQSCMLGYLWASQPTKRFLKKQTNHNRIHSRCISPKEKNLHDSIIQSNISPNVSWSKCFKTFFNELLQLKFVSIFVKIYSPKQWHRY